MGGEPATDKEVGVALTIALTVGLAVGGAYLYADAHQPAPASVRVVRVADKPHAWSKIDSRAYAHDQLIADADSQFACLDRLWAKESGWNPKAINPVKSMGLHAAGIPQLLGLGTKVSPPSQIDRGLSYIRFRYGTACRAWVHWLRAGWY